MDKRLSLDCRKDYNESCGKCEQLMTHQEITECLKKRMKRDNIRRGCLKLYRACEELNLDCQRVTCDMNKDGSWLENCKGIDDWKVIQRQNKKAA